MTCEELGEALPPFGILGVGASVVLEVGRVYKGFYC